MAAALDEARWQVPPLDREHRVIGGVASAMAREIGISPTYVRLVLVVLGVAGGWGLLLYGIGWLVMRERGVDTDDYVPVAKAASSGARLVGFGCIALGAVVLATQLQTRVDMSVIFPVALIGAAFAIAYDQGNFDRRQIESIHSTNNVKLRLVVGCLLLLGGAVTALALSFTFWQAVRSIVVAGLVLAGAAVLFAPMLMGLLGELLEERRRRIRSEEKAEMAAHLHDSVLQTLSLIQKRSDDTNVVNLARRQERELRSWLFEDKALHAAQGFRMTLEHIMGEVEDLHAVPIEVVVVGDRPVDPDAEVILLASREAATNAARHSGAGRIDVFAEVATDQIEVFVRDQGSGFNPQQIDDDRAGVRDSIRGRMQRHGGYAEIISSPGSGTEIELVMPLTSELEESVDA